MLTCVNLETIPPPTKCPEKFPKYSNPQCSGRPNIAMSKQYVQKFGIWSFSSDFKCNNTRACTHIHQANCSKCGTTTEQKYLNHLFRVVSGSKRIPQPHTLILENLERHSGQRCFTRIVASINCLNGSVREQSTCCAKSL